MTLIDEIKLAMENARTASAAGILSDILSAEEFSEIKALYRAEPTINARSAIIDVLLQRAEIDRMDSRYGTVRKQIQRKLNEG